MKKYLVYSAVYFAILFVVLKCGSSANVYVNYADNYKSSSSRFMPDFIVYHPTLDSTLLYFKFKSDELLYMRRDKSEPYRSFVTISYKITGREDKIFADSGTVAVRDEVEEKESKQILGKIGLKLAPGKDYRARLLITDVNRKTYFEEDLIIYKASENEGQFFMFKMPGARYPEFKNFASDNKERILISGVHAGRELTIKYFARPTPLSPPPFSLNEPVPFDHTPDSSFNVKLSQLGNLNFFPPDSGFIFVQSAPTTEKGKAFFRFSNNYPEIKTIDGMLFPSRYISTRNEYEFMSFAEDRKKAIDDFWLARAGSEERAREIIRKYYNRVEEANRYFTTHVEGWRTDRGMISVIFGIPDIIAKSRSEEIWIYGEESNSLSLRITFTKVQNPFSDNDFKMERNQGYRSSWYRAVDAWRSGRVYWMD